MIAIGSVLITIYCILRVTSTYVLQPGVPRILFRQQTAPGQERIINANPDSAHSVEDEESESYGGVKCGIGIKFYINQEGMLMRCDTSKLSEEEKPLDVPVQPQNSLHLLWPGLSTLGLAFWAGGRLPGVPVIQNQHTDGDQETYKKKPVIVKPELVIVKPGPVIVKPEPVIVKPVVVKPIVTKPVHKPIVHKHPHSTHHHPKPCVHVVGPGLTAYHQPGLSSVTQDGDEHLREKQFVSSPIQSDTYGYFVAPLMSILMPIQAQRILAKYVISKSINPEKGPQTNEDTQFSDDSREDELFTVRSDVIGNLSSSGLSPIVDDMKQVKGFNITTNSSSEIKRNSTAANVDYDRNDTLQHRKADESQAFKLSQLVDDKKKHEAVNVTANPSSEINGNPAAANNNNARNYSDGHRKVTESQTPNRTNNYGKKVNVSNAEDTNATEILAASVETEDFFIERPEEREQQRDEVRGKTISDYDVEPNAEKYEAAEDGVQNLKESLSEGPNVMEVAKEELDAAHIRKIRDTPEIPIEILNDQQRPSSSILDRNTLLTIMSSLKEQYLKNAEPDQKKLIEDAFDRLHCSVRDMKKLDERPTGKKIDGSKRAALKLLAERAQPLIEEPDYYSDATDDVSAEPSFLELLNVATKHKGKHSLEAE